MNDKSRILLLKSLRDTLESWANSVCESEKGRCEVSKPNIENHVNNRLMGIQQNGAVKAKALNFPVRSTDLSGDLIKYCPYPGSTIEALAWSAGYWSMAAGILEGDLKGVLKNETR